MKSGVKLRITFNGKYGSKSEIKASDDTCCGKLKIIYMKSVKEIVEYLALNPAMDKIKDDVKWQVWRPFDIPRQSRFNFESLQLQIEYHLDEVS